MQPAHQAVQFLDGFLGVPVRLLDDLPCLGRQILERGLGEPQVQRERDQPLLRAVVQVPFDTAAFGVGGVDRTGPALGQVLDAPFEFLGAADVQHCPADHVLQPHEGAGQGGYGGQDEQARDGGVPERGGVPAVLHAPPPVHREDPHQAGRRRQGRHQHCQHGEFEEPEERADQAVVGPLPLHLTKAQPWQVHPAQRAKTPPLDLGEAEGGDDEQRHRDRQPHGPPGGTRSENVRDVQDHPEEQQRRYSVQRHPGADEEKVAAQPYESTAQPRWDGHDRTVCGGLPGGPCRQFPLRGCNWCHPRSEPGVTDRGASRRESGSRARKPGRPGPEEAHPWHSSPSTPLAQSARSP